MSEPVQDPMAEREDTRAALGDAVYVAAYDALMSGAPESVLTDAERAAVRHARQMVGITEGPGLPAPIRRPAQEG